MATIASTYVPPPKSWDEFEDITLSAMQIRYKNRDFFRNGRQGQKQSGVDIWGANEQGLIVGIQCKNTANSISDKIIEDEVGQAESFAPAITHLYLATTAKRDAKLQEFARTLTVKRKEKGQFGLDLLFWDDVVQNLVEDESRFYKHYPQMKPTNEPKRSDQDRKLFEEFTTTFPFSPKVELLRDHDFGNPFPRQSIQPLINFIGTWNSVEKEFMDSDLEEKRRYIFASAYSLLNEISNKTTPMNNSSYLSVLPDRFRGEPRPEWVRLEAAELNSCASLFIPIYEEFVRFCKRTLYQ